ncbi:MAG: gamma-glutamylcyclotransferase family protein [Pseudomonadota bacterium]
MHRLFVYGTLAPGRSNHHHLKSLDGEWTPATLRGRLVAEGWGAAQGYPGIVPGGDGEAVSGWVLASPALCDHWARLDEFEGEGYERKVVTVTLANGTPVAAYVYALAPL